NKKLNKEQYLVPYLISSHPGSDLNAAVELAEYLRDLGYTPEQVQDFYPTPGTLSTCMFYTGLDPRSMKPLYVPKSPKEKAMQRALLQYRKKENYQLVYEALKEAGREDLIGFGKKCLIRPKRIEQGGFQRTEDRASKRGPNKKQEKSKTSGKTKFADRAAPADKVKTSDKSKHKDRVK
ncbi:MAG: DUF3362 domain-containing protein, partial [Clostridiales bacterium]|nr:DUF3362 domain-containing protein [Clostridiales bacterium]